MSTEEMLVVKRGYDFSKWLLNHTGKFPKSYRFSVATKIENAILDFTKSRKRAIHIGSCQQKKYFP